MKKRDSKKSAQAGVALKLEQDLVRALDVVDRSKRKVKQAKERLKAARGERDEAKVRAKEVRKALKVARKEAVKEEQQGKAGKAKDGGRKAVRRKKAK